MTFTRWRGIGGESEASILLGLALPVLYVRWYIWDIPITAGSYSITQVVRLASSSRSSLLASTSSAPAGGRGGTVRGGLHTMLTVQLAGHASSGELVKTRLTFVELASQDCKVRLDG